MTDLEVMEHCRLLLRGVSVLHGRGFGLTRISPGMSPSGLYWRLTITPATTFDPADPLGWQVRGSRVISWTSGNSPEFAGRVMTPRTTPEDVADHVLTLLPADTLHGEDTDYTRWYAELLAQCERRQTVPVAYSDSWTPHGWQIGFGGPEFAAPPPWSGHRAYPADVSDTVTPRTLAEELGVSQRAIRRWLRNQGWQSMPYARWQLTPDQADSVRRQFGPDEGGRIQR